MNRVLFFPDLLSRLVGLVDRDLDLVVTTPPLGLVVSAGTRLLGCSEVNRRCNDEPTLMLKLAALPGFPLVLVLDERDLKAAFLAEREEVRVVLDGGTRFDLTPVE